MNADRLHFIPFLPSSYKAEKEWKKGQKRPEFFRPEKLERRRCCRGRNRDFLQIVVRQTDRRGQDSDVLCSFGAPLGLLLLNSLCDKRNSVFEKANFVSQALCGLEGAVRDRAPVDLTLSPRFDANSVKVLG